jgi:hypothetical protein
MRPKAQTTKEKQTNGFTNLRAFVYRSTRWTVKRQLTKQKNTFANYASVESSRSRTYTYTYIYLKARPKTTLFLKYHKWWWLVKWAIWGQTEIKSLTHGRKPGRLLQTSQISKATFKVIRRWHDIYETKMTPPRPAVLHPHHLWEPTARRDHDSLPSAIVRNLVQGCQGALDIAEDSTPAGVRDGAGADDAAPWPGSRDSKRTTARDVREGGKEE